jgi:ElaB/YqjD/DUF883 family membrane-anchored ribosome-binding protein
MSNATQSHARQSNGKMPNMRDEIDGLKDTVKTGVQDVVEGGLGVVQAAGTVAKKKVADVRRQAADTRDTMAEYISDRPFTSVAIAAGVGAALGMMLMCRRK